MITGPKPKEQKVSRTRMVHDWQVVDNVPFEDAPPLSGVGRVPAATRAWWADVSTMPHCVLWRPSDWSFARDTARVHAGFMRGVRGMAAELRAREKIMGTTREAREGMRIRYLDPAGEAPAAPEEGPPVNFDDERRRRLMATD
ncbi:MAG TPA: hypothetical protein VJB57_04055 [Dehalococcoidia bacterium]|nr:hypothetical protein [Dehalococcoidia bacterium]